MGKGVLKYLSLVAINLIYACTSLCTRYASQQDFMSWKYLCGFSCAIGVMGVYAILWQQVLKRISLSMAYMFKGTSLVFVMILAALLFGEPITWMNIIGAVIIILGVALYAKA